MPKYRRALRGAEHCADRDLGEILNGRWRRVPTLSHPSNREVENYRTTATIALVVTVVNAILPYCVARETTAMPKHGEDLKCVGRAFSRCGLMTSALTLVRREIQG